MLDLPRKLSGQQPGGSTDILVLSRTRREECLNVMVLLNPSTIHRAFSSGPNWGILPATI